MTTDRHRLHPLIRAYVRTTEGLADVCRSPELRAHPVAAAITALREARSDRLPVEQAVAAAQGALLGEKDADLCCLLLLEWANFSSVLGRTSERDALLKRTAGTVTDETPAVLRADLAASAQAATPLDFAERYRNALKLLPGASWHHRRILLNLARHLAFHGMESEVDDRVRALAEGDNPVLANFARLVRLVQLAETGQVAEAQSVLASLDADSPTLGYFGNDLSSCRELLALMTAPAPGDGAGDTSVAGHLLARRPDLALEAARANASRRPSEAIQNGLFASFDLVRAELASGNGEAARRIIGRRQAIGNRHYIDDLFLARVERLAGNADAAARHMAAVLSACRRYRAEGRLDLELRLSCELSAGDLMALLRGAENARPPQGIPQQSLEADRAPARGLERLLGGSRAMSAVRQAVGRFAALDVPVLVTGETGTGKELVARALHEAGPRRDEPFVAINCGAIAESLLESELFGHEAGAFTGAVRSRRGLLEEAGRGTVLLDEIGDIAPRLQVALLRFLETGEIRPVGSSRTRRAACRVVAATNADLKGMSERDEFRRDLFYRLCRMEIHIPPLRERRRDIPALVTSFLAEGRPAGESPSLSPEAMNAFAAGNWAGNVRELRSAVERLRLMSSDRLRYDLAAVQLALPMLAGESSGREGATDDAAPAGPARPSRPQTGPRGGSARLADRGGAAIDDYLREGRGRMRRLARLREIFAEHRRLTRIEVAEIMGVSAYTATRDLQILGREKSIEKVMPNRSPRTHYFQLRSESQTTP